MMVINCSAAAALHLYGKYKKGVDEGFFEPSSVEHETVMERQNRFNDREIIQWVVHAVKIGRTTCLIAMELNTRWVHVIHRVRKGDVNGFVERLNTRLVNGIEWLGSGFSLMTQEEMNRSITRFFTQHTELRFYQQIDRSVMSHIAQVGAEYRDVYQGVGAFPVDEEMALEFDLRLNDTLRSRKDHREYWIVSETMLKYWLCHWVGKPEDEVSHAIAAMRKVKNDLEVNIFAAPEEEERESLHNVVDLTAFRNKNVR